MTKELTLEYLWCSASCAENSKRRVWRFKYELYHKFSNQSDLKPGDVQALKKRIHNYFSYFLLFSVFPNVNQVWYWLTHTYKTTCHVWRDRSDADSSPLRLSDYQRPPGELLKPRKRCHFTRCSTSSCLECLLSSIYDDSPFVNISFRQAWIKMPERRKTSLLLCWKLTSRA